MRMSTIYRNSVWFVKGMREYTRGGYEKASKDFKAADLENVDCSGKHYLITGSNSGIGKSIAQSIAERGGAIHLVCRNEQSANDTKDEIVRISNNEKVYVHKLDLSETSSIFPFASKFQEQHGQLDVLVNNAGCMVNTREVTADGNLEKNFATNTLGTYCLTEALLPLLKLSSDPRVITVTSGGMLTNKLDLSDLQSENMKTFDGTMVYAQNKRQQVVMTSQWANREPSIHFSCMHPGWSDTPAVRNSMPDFYEKMKDRLRTPAQGADTAVWLAVSPAVKQTPSGKFFQDRVAVSDHLPLACTKSTPEDKVKLMEVLKGFADGYRS